ncbi:hypothetical protein GSI_04492 [Ganoderma sinense ZZ0214-1]|uniref:Uncharacterized protein n=1 Tax=Ganoderma sinense ZZ0214-1 TaxID=1077348 RepID=A0A2G8SH04_9APHY|nr:hypothetical protein GSI_04492 [Ganoderma sinense ZZ0214-1]
MSSTFTPPRGGVSAAFSSFLPARSVKHVRLIVNRVATLIADMILIFVTWKFLPASALIARPNTMSFSSVMLRNGILYFVVLTMLNVVQLILTVGFPVVPDGILFNVWFMTFPLSSVLVSHFLLDLQEAHQRTLAGMATGDLLSISQNMGPGSTRFKAGALGSLGATLGFLTGQNQEEEGEGNDIGDDDYLIPAESACSDECEAIHELGSEGGSAITDVQSVEEAELDIMEVPRVGGGQASLGTL